MKKLKIHERWEADTLGFIYGFCQCLICEHLIDSDKKICKAFSEIPEKILKNEIPHIVPLKSQNNDFVFKRIKDVQ